MYFKVNFCFIHFSSSQDREFIADLRRQSDRDKSIIIEENRKLTAEVEKVSNTVSEKTNFIPLSLYASSVDVYV